MGTNYYLHIEKNKCDHCERSDRLELHIGKASAGWNFHFRAYNSGRNTGYNAYMPDDKSQNIPITITSYKEWQDWFDKYPIFDECNRPVTKEVFMKKVADKQTETRGYHDYLKDCNRMGMESFRKSIFLDSEGYFFTEWEFS